MDLQQAKIEVLKNTIRDSQYIVKERLGKFLKDNDLLEGASEPIDYYKIICEEIENNFEDINLKLQEYEYDKSFKYFSLYKFGKCNIRERVQKLRDAGIVNLSKEDDLTNKFKPTVKEYNNSIDFKFSFLIENENSSDKEKYIVIATILELEDYYFLLIKWSSVPEGYGTEGFYINNNKKIKKWISNKLNIELEEFNSMRVFKELHQDLRDNKNKYPNISRYVKKMTDEENGVSSFKASKKDVLPLIDSLLELTKEFKNEYDQKLVEEYIKKYEDESQVTRIGVKWKDVFSSSTGKAGSIAVCLEREFIGNNILERHIIHHIIQKNQVNRERINYVVIFLSKYSKKMDKKN